MQYTRRQVLKLAGLIGTTVALIGTGVGAAVAQAQSARPTTPPGLARHRTRSDRSAATAMLMNIAPPRPPVGPNRKPLQPGQQGGRP
jgi:hypothetical protein